MCYLRMVLFSLLPAALSCTDDGGYQPPKHMSATVINAQCRWLWCSRCPRSLHSRPMVQFLVLQAGPRFLFFFVRVFFVQHAHGPHSQRRAHRQRHRHVRTAVPPAAGPHSAPMCRRLSTTLLRRRPAAGPVQAECSAGACNLMLGG